MAYIFFLSVFVFVLRHKASIFAWWKVLKFSVITVLYITIDQYNIIWATQTSYGLSIGEFDGLSLVILNIRSKF